MDTTLLTFLRTLHLGAVVLWIGGFVSIAFVVGFSGGDSRAAIARAAHGGLLRVITPAMVVAWLSGLSVLIDGWATIYARAGWMHGKLTLALIVSALTGVFSGRLRKAAANADLLRPGVFRGVAVGTLLLAFLVIVLAKFRFGS